MPSDRPSDGPLPRSRPFSARGRNEELAVTAHDLRGALAVVVGRAQLLTRHLRATDDPSPARLLAGLAAIEGAAKRAAARLDTLERESGSTPEAPKDRPALPTDAAGDGSRSMADDR